MSTKRALGAALVAAVAVLITASFAGAAKTPTYQVYNKCSTSITCSGAAYFNKSRSRVVVAQVNKRCSDGTQMSLRFDGKRRVSRSGKFTAPVDLKVWDVTKQATVDTKGMISGKFKSRKRRVKLSYDLTAYPEACAPLAKGSVTLKYKGTQTGG